MGSTDDSKHMKRLEQKEDQKDSKNADPVKPKADTTTTKSASINMSGSTARPRHDSTSSNDSARSPSCERLKRRRTTSLSSSPLSSFFFPPTAMANASRSPSSASPLLSSSPTTSFLTSSSSIMSLDEVVNAVNGVTNMALAHEIALDSNFKLEKFEPPVSSLERQVKDVMHQAFWDNLKEQLEQEPPVYTQAFVLITEVRDQLLELTLPYQNKLKQEISEKLDMDLMKQQADHGVLNFAEYSGFVVNLMAKLCAPVRDEAIEKLRQESDVVSVFRGVAETLDLMKLDMANYTIQVIRPTIMKQIVEYEKEKFKLFLQTQNDGLELTRQWILEHIESQLQKKQPQLSGDVKQSSQQTTENNTTKTPQQLLADPISLRTFCHTVLNNSYMTLLQWPLDKLIPETMCVDSERILELRDRLHQLCILASLLLVSLSTVQQVTADCVDEIRARLKRDVCPILDPAFTISETLEALPNLVEQVISSVQSFLKEKGREEMSDALVTALRAQLTQLKDPDHRITALVTQRIMSFFGQIFAAPGTKVTIPAPFLILQEEVARIWRSFLRISQHNRSVFGEYYFDITEGHLKKLVTQGGHTSRQNPSEDQRASDNTTDNKNSTEANNCSDQTNSGKDNCNDNKANSVSSTDDNKSSPIKDKSKDIRWDDLDLD